MLVSNANNAALALFQSASPKVVAPVGPLDAGRSMIAVANGFDADPGEATGTAKDDYFAVNDPSVTQIKLHLFEKVGEALGIDQDDFENNAAYADALSEAVLKIEKDPKAKEILAGIEKELGLDKLQMSIHDVIKAIADDTGTESAMLTERLEEEYELVERLREDAEKEGDPQMVRIDALGLYAPR